MKKFILTLAIISATIFSSCVTTKNGRNYTATTVEVSPNIISNTLADLEVGDRVTFSYTTKKEDRSGYNALPNCKAAAIQAMLNAYDNADVIVAPNSKYDSDLRIIEVTGRPAKYKNFRSAK